VILGNEAAFELCTKALLHMRYSMPPSRGFAMQENFRAGYRLSAGIAVETGG
jgi:hypothetical protein